MRRCYRGVLPVLFWAVGCGKATEPPVAFSQPVGINLKAKSGDVRGGSITDEKGINTESGNPYGAFVAAARQALGGRDASRIEVGSLALILGAGSSGVVSLDQVVAGQVDVLFKMNDTNNTYPVGKVTNPTGGGPVSLSIDFQPAQVSSEDFAKLLNGSFKVVVRGTAAAGFATRGAEAVLQLTFAFRAY